MLARWLFARLAPSADAAPAFLLCPRMCRRFPALVFLGLASQVLSYHDSPLGSESDTFSAVRSAFRSPRFKDRSPVSTRRARSLHCGCRHPAMRILPVSRSAVDYQNPNLTSRSTSGIHVNGIHLGKPSVCLLPSRQPRTEMHRTRLTAKEKEVVCNLDRPSRLIQQ